MTRACDRAALARSVKSSCRGLALAVSVVLLGAACSGTDPDPQAATSAASASADAVAANSEGPGSPAGSPEPSEEASSDADADAEPGAPTTPENETGTDSDDGFTPYEERVYPLSAFIAELVADVYEYPDLPDPMSALEEMKYDCMTEQGFRYAKIDWDAIDAQYEAAEPSLAEEDYMPTRGYGVADSLDTPEAIEIEDPYVDPNEAIKKGLSAAELEAWEDHRMECVIEAQERAFNRPGYSIAHFALRDELADIEDRIAADPRIAGARQQWSACMAEQGHSYTSKDEIFEYLHSISGPLLDRLMALGGHDHIDAAFQADLDALMAVEVEIAVADLACKQPLEQTEYEVRVEHEERFLEDHEDRLALLRQELPTMTLPPADDPEYSVLEYHW